MLGVRKVSAFAKKTLPKHMVPAALSVKTQSELESGKVSTTLLELLEDRLLQGGAWAWADRKDSRS